MLEKMFEKMLESSSYTDKLAQSISLVALESKKIAETLIFINDRLNAHEKVILHLVESQKKSKEASDFSLKSIKQEPSKPN